MARENSHVRFSRFSYAIFNRRREKKKRLFSRILKKEITHYSTMTNPRLTKLRKQPDSTWATTWALLQQRLIAVPDPVQKLFQPDV